MHLNYVYIKKKNWHEPRRRLAITATHGIQVTDQRLFKQNRMILHLMCEKDSLRSLASPFTGTMSHQWSSVIPVLAGLWHCPTRNSLHSEICISKTGINKYPKRGSLWSRVCVPMSVLDLLLFAKPAAGHANARRHDCDVMSTPARMQLSRMAESLNFRP